MCQFYSFWEVILFQILIDLIVTYVISYVSIYLVLWLVAIYILALSNSKHCKQYYVLLTGTSRTTSCRATLRMRFQDTQLHVQSLCFQNRFLFKWIINMTIRRKKNVRSTKSGQMSYESKNESTPVQQTLAATAPTEDATYWCQL